MFVLHLFKSKLVIIRRPTFMPLVKTSVKMQNQIILYMKTTTKAFVVCARKVVALSAVKVLNNDILIL